MIDGSSAADSAGTPDEGRATPATVQDLFSDLSDFAADASAAET